MQLFNVNQSGSNNVDLTPIQGHVDEYKLLQIRVNHFSYIFVLQVVFRQSSELIPSQGQQMQLLEFFGYLKVLVPGVQQVLVKV